MTETPAHLYHHARRIRLCWNRPAALVLPELTERGPSLGLELALEGDRLILAGNHTSLSDVFSSKEAITPQLDGVLADRLSFHFQLTARRETLSDDLSRWFADATDGFRTRFVLKVSDSQVARALARYAPDLLWGYDAQDLWQHPNWSDKRNHEWLLSGLRKAAQGASIIYLPARCTIEGLERGLNLIALLQERGFTIACGPHTTGHADTAPFLEASLAAGADIIVTDNPTHLAKTWKSVPLRRPSASTKQKAG